MNFQSKQAYRGSMYFWFWANYERIAAVPTKWRVGLQGLCGVLFLAACSAAATDCNQNTFVVNTFIDLDDLRCDAVHCSLREAVNAANSCTVHDRYTIELPAGDYELTLRGPDLRGDLNVDSEIAINGMGASPSATVIRGEDTWVNSIFDISSEGTLIISNVTIKGGRASSYGGGVYNEGHLETHDVDFDNNEASIDGGAIYNLGIAILYEGEVTENEASGGSGVESCGGGIYNSGDLQMSRVVLNHNSAWNGDGLCNEGEGTVLAANSTINNNGLGSSGLGGGIYDAGSRVTLSNSTLSNNEAELGGGIYSQGNLVSLIFTVIAGNSAVEGGGIYASTVLGELSLSEVVVEENKVERVSATSRYDAWGGNGGGLFLGGYFEISDSLIQNNAADEAGGGLYVDTSHPVGGGVLEWSDIDRSISHSAIISNTANSGGGVFVQYAQLTIENTTLSSNHSSGSTGLAVHVSGGGVVNLENATIAHHYLGIASGAAVFNDPERSGRIIFKNTLIGDNHIDCEGPNLFSLGGNAADDLSSCHLGRGFGTLSDSPFAVSGDGFRPLTEIDGTWVHPLVPPHPAVDYVAEAECPWDDQRRVRRPQGVRCDIGAFEVEIETISEDVGELELATVTPTPGAILAILTSNARCRTGPGFVYGDYDFFDENDSTAVYARIADSSWYQVQAPNLSGKCWVGQAVLESDVSPEVLLSLPVLQPPATPTFTPAPSAPEAPSGLQAAETACNAVDGYKVKLTWNDNSDNESGFRIYHNGQQVATVGANVAQYTHTVPDNYAQQQSYYVAAYNDAGSANSNTATEDGCLY